MFQLKVTANCSGNTNFIFFLTAIWLPHGQLWAIIGGTALLTHINRCVLHFELYVRTVNFGGKYTLRNKDFT